MKRWAWAAAAAALWIAPVGLLPGAAHAIEPQYRRVTLVDGRVISAEILATEAQGLKMRVPAGETLIPFELLLDMVPISQSEYDGQVEWVVYYSLPSELEQQVVELLDAIDGLALQSVAVSDHGITFPMGSAAQDCKHEIGCIVGVVSGAPWMWVLTAGSAPTGGWRVQAKLNTSPDDPTERIFDIKDRNELWKALHEVLGLSPPTSPAPRSGTGEEPVPSANPFDERKVVALSFVPVPGLPSLAQKDTGGFALAMGVVVPSTVVWVSAVGQLGSSAPEFGALSFAGYYAVTVFANQVAGMRSLEKQRIGVTATPTERGGAAVRVGGRF